nr:PREDICTED: uncharacterized protein LOC108209153 isoform X2 [Daucus carota subsp. sativus]
MDWDVLVRHILDAKTTNQLRSRKREYSALVFKRFQRMKRETPKRKAITCTTDILIRSESPPIPACLAADELTRLLTSEVYFGRKITEVQSLTKRSGPYSRILHTRHHIKCHPNNKVWYDPMRKSGRCYPRRFYLLRYRTSWKFIRHWTISNIRESTNFSRPQHPRHVFVAC